MAPCDSPMALKMPISLRLSQTIIFATLNMPKAIAMRATTPIMVMTFVTPAVARLTVSYKAVSKYTSARLPISESPSRAALASSRF